MGAVCARLDISSEVVRTLSPNQANYIHDASFETIWKHIAPHINDHDKRIKIQRLLRAYLHSKPCKDHYLSLKIDGRTWLFEIQTNRRLSNEATEIVLTSRVASPTRFKKLTPL